MAKLEKRLAYYEDGTILEAKTAKKSFDNNGLVGIVSIYSDGTREQENPETTENIDDVSPVARATKIRLKKALEFKSDGGDTPEIRTMLREERK